jgi:spindle assembly abnormal protein 6
MLLKQQLSFMSRPAQVLRIHASSEDDPYFLHTLEVTEEEFQCLKADQGILVDFASFPGKIISLLERCIGSHASDTPRFQAVLACRPADSTLKIVETNDFKQLAHITLAFKPGNDFTVKQVCWPNPGQHSIATAATYSPAQALQGSVYCQGKGPQVAACVLRWLCACLFCSSWRSGWAR